MRTVIGVMGSGRPLPPAAAATARHLGSLIAAENWVLLTGGRASGVMDACSQGARVAGGFVVGVLPDVDTLRASSALDIAICTGFGDARNVVNVLSSDVVIALPGGAGTLSEVALALSARKPMIALGWDPGAAARAAGRIIDADTPEAAIEAAKDLLAKGLK
ncbi:MAG: LOG family protein [Actinomycetia bacterium]|nr:LOG family protein [Actinomycetes bacterium]